MASVEYIKSMLTRELATTDYDSEAMIVCKKLSTYIAKEAGFCPITDRRYTGDFSESQTEVIATEEAYEKSGLRFQENVISDKGKDKDKDQASANIYASLQTASGKKAVFTAGMDGDFPDGITGGLTFSSFLLGAVKRTDFVPLENCVNNQTYKVTFVPPDVLATGNAKTIAAHKEEAKRTIMLNKRVVGDAVRYLKANMSKCMSAVRKGFRADPEHVRRTLKYPFAPFLDDKIDEEEDAPIDKALQTLEMPTRMDDQDRFAVEGPSAMGMLLNTGWVNRFGKAFPQKSYSKSDKNACFRSKETLLAYGAMLYSMPVYIFEKNAWVPLSGVSLLNLNCGARWIVAYHPILLISKDKGNSIKNVLVAAYLVAPPQMRQLSSDTTALQGIMAAAPLKRPYVEMDADEVPEESATPEPETYAPGGPAPGVSKSARVE